MKIVLPLVICSAIFAALGYYFGRISGPMEPAGNNATQEAGSTQAPAPQSLIVEAERETEPDPAPVESAPETTEAPTVPETTEASTVPEPTTTTAETDPPPAVSEDSFAERAALRVQTLRDTEGRTLQGTILEVTDREVTIRQPNGVETPISINLLSEEDVRFCNYLREQQEKEEEAKPAVDEDAFDWDSYFNS